MWFDADQLAAASTIEIGSAAIPDSNALEIAALQIAPRIDRVLEREAGLSLASLPGWPGAGPSGQGLGASLGAAIGPLQPGFVAVLGGARGSGRTSLLAQLVDGLALHEAAPRRPILLLGDDPAWVWRARSLARFADVDPRRCCGGELPREQVAAFEHAWAALDRWQRFASLDQLARIDALLDELLGLAVTTPAHAILVVDALAASEARAQLAGLARLARERAVIVLIAADDDDFTRSEDRHLDLRLRLRPEPEQGRVAIELVHRRLGPRETFALAWSPASGRFSPLDEPP